MPEIVGAGQLLPEGGGGALLGVHFQNLDWYLRGSFSGKSVLP